MNALVQTATQAQLIPVFAGTIAGQSVQLVNARDLHSFLQIGRDFTNWIKSRISKYGFVENQDFEVVENLSSPNLASAKSRQQSMSDYHLTLDTGKELAMVENNDKGREVRRYFIECERQSRVLPFNPQKDIQDELYRVSGGKQTVRNELSRMLRDRFGVARYQDIPDHQCQAAVEYIRSLKVEVVNKPLAVITDADKVTRAYAIAAEVGSRASQTVFEAVMSDEDWCNKRCLFGVTGNAQGQYMPYVMSIADNALIATIAELPSRILMADLRSSNKEIFDIATACNQKLAQRFSRMEQNALTKQ